MDCARVAKRLGYESVAILYRRSREEMPANAWEVDDTIEEEIDIQYLTFPVRILGENGQVSGVECVRMKLGEPDKSGRRRPIPVEGSEFMVPADTVVTALGQVPDFGCLPPQSEITISNRGLLTADAQTGVDQCLRSILRGRCRFRSEDGGGGDRLWKSGCQIH